MLSSPLESGANLVLGSNDPTAPRLIPAPPPPGLLRYRRALIARGVYHFPLPTKQGSISAAHTEKNIDETLAVTDAVLTEGI